MTSVGLVVPIVVVLKLGVGSGSTSIEVQLEGRQRNGGLILKVHGLAVIW